MSFFKNRHLHETAIIAPATPPGLTPLVPLDGQILEHRLREAVAGHKFQLHYQPMVAVGERRVAGVEALLRWESEVGRVSPATFLPVLEDTRLINDLGPWVLAQACRQARPWVDADPRLFVAVNVSPVQLEAGFADWVLGTLSTLGFPPSALCLELVRPALIEDPMAAWAELRRLKAADIRLVVDDFGALGSSIADLRRFAVDAVKIDPTFVHGLGWSPEDEAVVGAVIALAHALGMQTVAESVETASQADRLQALGCDLAQGFYFMEPGPADALQGLFAGASTPIG